MAPSSLNNVTVEILVVFVLYIIKQPFMDGADQSIRDEIDARLAVNIILQA